MVDTYQVPVACSVRASEAADAIQCDATATVNCNQEQLIMLAGRALSISFARVIRADMNSDGVFKKSKWMGATLEASDLLRGVLDPAKLLARASTVSSKLTGEGKKMLIEELKRQIAGD